MQRRRGAKETAAREGCISLGLCAFAPLRSLPRGVEEAPDSLDHHCNRNFAAGLVSTSTDSWGTGGDTSTGPGRPGYTGRRMDCLALDFDGVLVSSSNEVFVVALRTFAQLSPSSKLVQRWSQVAEDPTACLPQLASDPQFAAYHRLIPLGNRAEDFGAAFLALEAGLDLHDQQTYDAFFAAQHRPWLTDFHAAFYEQRSRLRSESLARWLALHEPYRPFLDLLHRRRDCTRLTIATAKDRGSVSVLLGHLGASELVPDEMIFDKETGIEKTHHLRAIASTLGIGVEGITFVDDKVNHLRRVAGLGVRPVLAGWGHNSPREHAAALDAGFPVATLTTAKETLLGADRSIAATQ